MRYFLPDAQDLVDPSFDFTRESRSPDRIRQRDDHYAHEVFATRPYDGLLVSKALVEAPGGGRSHYPQTQRLRLLREGARAFFRIHGRHKTLRVMGDCGAFSYRNAEAPPFGVDDVLEFYEACGFDYGISVDHIVLDYDPSWDAGLFGNSVPAQVRDRYALSLELARDFLATHRAQGARHEPIGSAQGWSPASYAAAVEQLQRMGYGYVALGGIVPLRSNDLLDVLRAVYDVRAPATRIHLLGVARIDYVARFKDLGVASFDSTSPLLQAFKDGQRNYHTKDGDAFMAIRVPQIHGNARVRARVEAGEIDMDRARLAERRVLDTFADYERTRRDQALEHLLEALVDFEAVHDLNPTSRVAGYRRTLEAAPWRSCPCEVCMGIGHHVIMLRGAERNRRRGFHNVWTLYQRLGGAVGRRVREAPALGRWDFFWTTPAPTGVDHDEFWHLRAAECGILYLPQGTSLDVALAQAMDAWGIETSDHKVGIFEIQTDEGIYHHVGGCRNLAAAQEDEVVFRTWDQKAAEDDGLVVGLVSCTKDKHEDRGALPAAELYTKSWTFRRSRTYVERYTQQWFVLSAKHGLVAPDEVIEPYDKTLATMTKQERDAWGAMVREQLDQRFGDQQVRYVVLAGQRYCAPLDGRMVTDPLRGKGTGERRQWLKRNT